MTIEVPYKVNISIKGTRPLLQNRFIPEQSNVKRRGKKYDPKEQAKKSRYLNEKEELIQPANHIEACLVKSAVQFRIPGQGKKTYKDAFKGGVLIDPLEIVHKIQDWEALITPVVISRARVLAGRAMLKEWELDFTAIISDERISPETFKDVLENAGKFIGIGDWRPKYGQFEVIKFEPI